jgi:GntR family transcriptional regulator
MHLKLDFRSKMPIYVQIVEQVRDLWVTGVLCPGDQLPTIRELAAELQVNFNTVARAYRLLHQEAVISTQQGRGTFALARPRSSDVDRLRGERLASLVDSWLAEAGRFGYRPDEVEEAWTPRFGAWASKTTRKEGS